MPLAPQRHTAAPSRLGSTIAGGLALALMLAGCATSQAAAPAPSGTEEVEVAQDLGGESLSGTGPTAQFPDGLDIVIPTGAQSVTVDFECTTGRFGVELGDSMMLGQTPANGTCGGLQQLAWPLTEQTDPVLHITVGDGVAWTAETRFSTAAFAWDDAVTADCETFSEIYSALINADTGYSFYQKVDAEEWETRVDDAAAALSDAANAAKSDLGEQFSALAAVVSDPSRTVGNAMAGAAAPIDAIHLACNRNQTPIVTVAEFGG
jgi:hypothetical protein